MNESTGLLQYIHQNAQMGMEAVETLMGVVEDPQTLEHLKKQSQDYKGLMKEAEAVLHRMGEDERNIPPGKKIMSYISINMQAMRDKTPAHIAEMMMQGSVMGIIDITKNLKRRSGASGEITQMGGRLLKLEEDSLEQWKRYLSITVE